MQQSRNRRKPRPITDHALLTLHKYYLRAEYMRGHFGKARDAFIEKYGANGWKENTKSSESFFAHMYLDYWYAGIFVVMEGYEKLGLNIPKVESLRKEPLYSKLRAYRGGTYHFREKYFDDSTRNFLGEKESSVWLSKLDRALGEFLLMELQNRKKARELSLNATEQD